MHGQKNIKLQNFESITRRCIRNNSIPVAERDMNINATDPGSYFIRLNQGIAEYFTNKYCCI